MVTSPSAAGGRYSEGAVCAAVDKIEGMRKPENFIGHRKRVSACGQLVTTPGGDCYTAGGHSVTKQRDIC